jgi:hypothetical protein
MATKGGQPGNNNAGKGRHLSKLLADRLAERAQAQELMDVLLEKALTGDMMAIKEVFDRIDGKPKQAIVGGDEDDAPIKIHQIERIIVRAKDPNG